MVGSILFSAVGHLSDEEAWVVFSVMMYEARDLHPSKHYFLHLRMR